VCVSAALAAATTRSAIYGAALVGGALNGLTAVAVSLTIMSQVPVYRRGLAFGLRMAGLPSAAAVAGLGAYLAAAGHLSWRHFYWVAAAVALLAGILMRSRRTGHESSAPAQARTGMDGGGRTLFLLGLCGLLGSLGTATVTPFLIDGLIAQGQKAGTAAGVLTLAGWLGIVSRVAVGALSDHVPDPLTHLRASAGFLLVLAASMAFLAVGHGAFLLVGATLMAFSLGLSWPGLFVFATLATHRSRAARAASNVQFGQHSGAVIGPAIFGLIVARHSFAIAWTTTAVVVGLAAILMLNVTRLLSEETRT
jgi:MFS family permease